MVVPRIATIAIGVVLIQLSVRFCGDNPYQL